MLGDPPPFCFYNLARSVPAIFGSPVKKEDVSEAPSQQKKDIAFAMSFFVVEVTGLEPTTSWSLTKRATKLRYTSSLKTA